MKSYLRFLSQNKLYAIINISGLVVSLMFIILIGDYAWRQYSIDGWHKNAERIYVFGSQDDFFMWPQAAEDIKAKCPEVEQTCCVMSQIGKIKHREQELRDTEHGIIMLTDPSFFDFFDFRVSQGDARQALETPDRCVITKSMARQFFAGENPIGQELQLVGVQTVFVGDHSSLDSTQVYTVAAVIDDLDHTVLPNETKVIVNMKRFPQLMGYELTPNVMAYGSTGACKAFFMLRPGATLDSKQETISNLLKGEYHIWNMLDDNYNFTLTPLRDIMFASQNNGYGLEKGNRDRLHILLAAVLAILFFAVSNYINLTVANTGFRAKEMATRRLFGSSQRSISLKLIGESTLMVALAFALGLALAFSFQDDAATLFQGKININADITPGSIATCLTFILSLGIISGLLPSRYLSRYQPIDIVKGSFRFRSKLVLGRIFIIVQNIITIVMLTAALVIWLQINHLVHAPLGYNTENLFYLSTSDDNYQTVRNRLAEMPFVEAVGEFSGSSFTNYTNSIMTINQSNRDKGINLYTAQLDSTAFALYGLTLLEDYTSGAAEGYYLTEEAMRQFGYGHDDRILDLGSEKVPLAGVFKDFHKYNVLASPLPFCIRLVKDFNLTPYLLVKTNGDKTANAAFEQMFLDLGLGQDKLKWLVMSLDENVAESFEDQQNTLKIITLFTLVAIVISVLGFIGMSLFFIRQRQKEIGIRKIMGSSSREVSLLMLRTFCSPLLVSFVIAIPISYYIMSDWLTNFSYRIELSPWIFIVTCLFALLIAILSVGFQIIKAVRTNPVESIRTE